MLTRNGLARLAGELNIDPLRRVSFPGVLPKSKHVFMPAASDASEGLSEVSEVRVSHFNAAQGLRVCGMGGACAMCKLWSRSSRPDLA